MDVDVTNNIKPLERCFFCSEGFFWPTGTKFHITFLTTRFIFYERLKIKPSDKRFLMGWTTIPPRQR